MKHLILASTACALFALTGCSNTTDTDTNSNTGGVDTQANAQTELELTMAATAQMDAAIAAGAGLDGPQAWLEANAKRDGVKTTQSGLQYSVIASGDQSAASARPGQMVKVHYEGRLADGSVFDSSYERGEPAVFPSDRLVPGWVEALSLMKPGDSWVLYIKPELGYGVEGRPPVIPENSVMLFRMELIEVDQTEDVANQHFAAAMSAGQGITDPAQWLTANAKRDNVITRESGLQYSVVKAGDTSGASPIGGQMVQVHYEGRLTDGTIFDSSYARGQPAAFPSDQLVPGWVEALSVMKPGDQWVLYVPPALGYGEGGQPPVIPPNAIMIFRMELLAVAN